MDQEDLVPEPSSAALGRTIKALRAQRGIERKEFAEQAGLSYSYLSEIENGKKKPAENIQHAIAKSLDYDVADLLRAAVKLDEQMEATSEEDSESLKDPVWVVATPRSASEADPELAARVTPTQIDLSETPSVEFAELQDTTHRMRIIARDLKTYGQDNDLVEPTKLQNLITDAANELRTLVDSAALSLGQLMLKNFEQERAKSSSAGDETSSNISKRFEELFEKLETDIKDFPPGKK